MREFLKNKPVALGQIIDPKFQIILSYILKNMHKEILTKEQVKLFPSLKKFYKKFGLVGGTAVALHIGHRESIDFDMFSLEKFGNLQIRNRISEDVKIDTVIVNKLGEFTIMIDGVKFTFFHYPFKIKFSENFEDTVRLPDLLTLAAMKAHALGQRNKWKDYVDLYFIIKDFYSVDKISKKAEEIFKGEFNERMFRTQLSYFDDINYSERVVFRPGFETAEKTIKKELIEFVT